uniref:Uncharacterized protein n=1 Tax=Triticum urartu TaxID=4572 RepID=A0A8R7PFZ1_TRIUA
MGRCLIDMNKKIECTDGIFSTNRRNTGGIPCTSSEYKMPTPGIRCTLCFSSSAVTSSMGTMWSSSYQYFMTCT